jgi:hypothetical protein
MSPKTVFSEDEVQALLGLREASDALALAIGRLEKAETRVAQGDLPDQLDRRRREVRQAILSAMLSLDEIEAEVHSIEREARA